MEITITIKDTPGVTSQTPVITVTPQISQEKRHPTGQDIADAIKYVLNCQSGRLSESSPQGQ